MAAPLTPEQALDRAMDSQLGISTKKMASAKLKGMVLSRSIPVSEDKEDIAALYIFNSPDNAGFLITSADDSLRPVIAYSGTGNYDYANLPESAKWWISEYQREINWYLSNNSTSESSSSEGQYYEQPERPEIPYMVQTLWNQGTPYNSKCPVFNGQKSVTGCVATAMAQVVKYHNFAIGKGSIRYGTRTYNTEINFNFKKWTPQWEDMLDTYVNFEWTEAQEEAVALLMRACGSAVCMDYTPQASGAFTSDIRSGLIKYMSYSEDSFFLNRGGCIADWDEICYDALQQGYPILYSGSGSAGGHCFVCDGYDGEGLFHINWGWGGGGPDGMYALSALNPEALGIGGGAGGFNYSQCIVIAVPGDGEHTYIAPEVEILPIYGENFVARGKDDSISFQCDVHTSSIDGEKFYFGYLMTDDKGYPIESEILYACELPQPQYYYPADMMKVTVYPEYLPSLEDGTYYFYPAYMLADEFSLKPMHLTSSQQCYALTVRNGKIKRNKATESPEKFDLQLTHFSPEALTIGENNSIEISITNYGALAYDSESPLYMVLRCENPDYVPEPEYEEPDDNGENSDPDGDNGENNTNQQYLYYIREITPEFSILPEESLSFIHEDDFSELEIPGDYDIFIVYPSKYNENDLYAVTASPVKAVLKSESGVESVNSSNRSLRYELRNGAIHLYNLNQGDMVEVINLQGIVIDKVICMGSELILNLPAGVSIVNTPRGTLKISL